jgi:hypothetical protein
VAPSIKPGATFSADLFGFDVTDELLLSNFGASIPPAAKIVGVTVTLTKYADDDANDRVVALSLKGAIAGSSLATTAAWPTSSKAFEYGGATDTWSAALTGADVSDPTFGVAISLNAGAFTDKAEVRDVSIKVTYCQ